MIKCDPRAKERCPYKKSCCGDEAAYFVEGSECDKFNQDVLSPPPTNADHIRSMTDEELAVEIMCPYHIEPEMCNTIKTCNDCCLDWLKQPYKEET